MADSWAASAIWGRVGAAILAFVALVLGHFGYTVGEAEQAAAYEIIATILTALSGVLALVSKIRESKKAVNG